MKFLSSTPAPSPLVWRGNKLRMSVKFSLKIMVPVAGSPDPFPLCLCPVPCSASHTHTHTPQTHASVLSVHVHLLLFFMFQHLGRSPDRSHLSPSQLHGSIRHTPPSLNSPPGSGQFRAHSLLSPVRPRYSDQEVITCLPVSLHEVGSTKDHIIVWGRRNELPLASVLRCMV